MSRLKAEYKRLKKLVKRSPILYVRLADIELQMGKVKEARNRLLNGIESDPENPTAHVLLAQAQGRLKDAEASLKSYEEVLRLDPLNLRARKAYVDLLHLLGRTDLEYAAHTRLYELSPSDEEIENKQKELVHWTMQQLFGDDFEWKDEWHPGDVTEIGGLSTVVSKELNLMPERATLPKQFSPDVDDSLVTQMIARLPSSDDDEQVEEFKLPGQKTEADAESTNGAGQPAEDLEATNGTKDDYDPDSNLLQHTEPTEPRPAAEKDAAAGPETAQPIVDGGDNDAVASEAPAAETESNSTDPSGGAGDQSETLADGEDQESVSTDQDEEESESEVEDLLAELISEGTADGDDEEEEYVPTPLEKAIQLGGQPIDEVVDFKQVISELEGEEPVLVEQPDLEAMVPDIKAPPASKAPADAEDMPESDEEGSKADEPVSETESKPEADPETEPVAENVDEGKDQPETESSDAEEASSPAAAEPEADPQTGGQLNQSDLDSLLAQFKTGNSEPETSTEITEEPEAAEAATDSPAESTVEPISEEAEDTDSKSAAADTEKPEPASSRPMDQSALDELMESFNSVKSNPETPTTGPAVETEPASAEESPESTPVEPTDKATSEQETQPDEMSGPMDQSTLDALMASFKTGQSSPASSSESEPEPSSEEVDSSDQQQESEAEQPAEESSAQDSPGVVAEQDQPVAATPRDEKEQSEPESAAVPKEPASQEDLDDLIAQFASKRQAKPGSQKPVEIGKYSSKPQPAENSVDDSAEKQEKPAPDKATTAESSEPPPKSIATTTDNDSSMEENITEGLKPEVEKVPELTEDELARRASYAMGPSRVEDEVESLEDEAATIIKPEDTSARSTEDGESFKPYGLSSTDQPGGDEPDASDSESVTQQVFEPAPEEKAIPKSKPVPEPPDHPKPQSESSEEVKQPVQSAPQDAPEPQVEQKPELSRQPEPAPAPPPTSRPAQPKAETKPAGMKPLPKRTPPPPTPKRDETAPDEYRGPVSKTLIRLQIGQGKYEHARAMLNRLRQQSPSDPDLDKLAEQIEAAIT